MAILCTVTSAPKGPRDLVRRNLKAVERALSNCDKSITDTELFALITDIIGKDLDLSKKKSKKAE